MLCRALAEMGVAYDERFLHELRSAIVLRGPHKIVILPEKPVGFSTSWPKVPAHAPPGKVNPAVSTGLLQLEPAYYM